MKKYIIFLFLILLFPVSGCTIDYQSYYEKYGDVVNKNDPTKGLVSSMIEDGVLSYPSSNTELIEQYGEVYSFLEDEYYVYSSYYSNNYDTLYIAYDNKINKKQTIDSKDLALIEEHLINYFESDLNKSEYKEYLKVVRIYPDYESSSCRKQDDPNYNLIEGCADYNQLYSSISINKLTDIDRFFNPLIETTETEIIYTEPKRDTFAHEYGHISTYYHMVLKSDNNYTDYLKVRLGDAFDEVYPNGILTKYDSSDTYKIQPSEILADDYVELFYNTSNKVNSDIYDYELEYDNLRNSLSNINGVVGNLSSDRELYNQVKNYYSLFLNKNETIFEEPVVVNANGEVFNTIHDAKNHQASLMLDNKDVIVLGEIIIDGEVYYRVVISNIVMGDKDYIENYDIRDHSNNIGYILKSNASSTNKKVMKFTKFNGVSLNENGYLHLESIETILLPHYDFSYYIEEGENVKIYNFMEEDFDYKLLEKDFFE